MAMDVLEEAELPLEKPLTQAGAAVAHARNCSSHMHVSEATCNMHMHMHMHMSHVHAHVHVHVHVRVHVHAHVTCHVSEAAAATCAPHCMQAGINFALRTADMMVQNGDKRAEIDRDIRAIDMSQDGQLADWFKSMSKVDARTRCLAGDLANRGGQMQTRLMSIAAAMHYLQTSGRLTGLGDGTPMPGLGPKPGTDSGGGKQPMQAAVDAAARVVQGGRVRVEPRPRQPAPREVSEPRPRLPRYRSSRTENEKEQHGERKGGKATPMALRPAVRALSLPVEGRAPGRDVQRKHLSQEDYERRDQAPVPTTNITYGEGVGGRIFSAIASCAKLATVKHARQHDSSLDVERVGRRSHREARSLVPPRTRDLGKADSAPRSPHLAPQAPDEAKISQIGWLERATSAARSAISSPAADSEEYDDEDGAEAEQGASASGREADGDVDFTADRAPSSTRQRRRKQRSGAGPS